VPNSSAICRRTERQGAALIAMAENDEHAVNPNEKDVLKKMGTVRQAKAARDGRANLYNTAALCGTLVPRRDFAGLTKTNQQARRHGLVVAMYGK